MAHSEKTDVGHWEEIWSPQAKTRTLSAFGVGTRNVQRLLRSHVKPESRFLEIGCAPGTMLLWVRQALHAHVSGLDYSETGISATRNLFKSAGEKGDLRCENVFTTTFEPASFDVVFSAGVIEHFNEPREIVARHSDLLRPSGVAIITIPNYGGFLGRLQGKLFPENLAIHNLSIMTPRALRALAPAGVEAKAYHWGRFSPGVLTLERIPFGRTLKRVGNLAGLLQPIDISALAPLLVMELRKTH